MWMSGGGVGGCVCVCVCGGGGRGGEGGGSSYNSLCEEVPPKRGTFFRFQVYERARISPVEVYESVGSRP